MSCLSEQFAQGFLHLAYCMYLDVSLGYLLAGDESLYWDDKNNVVPGEIEILIEKVVSSISFSVTFLRVAISLIIYLIYSG